MKSKIDTSVPCSQTNPSSQHTINQTSQPNPTHLRAQLHHLITGQTIPKDSTQRNEFPLKTKITLPFFSKKQHVIFCWYYSSHINLTVSPFFCHNCNHLPQLSSKQFPTEQPPLFRTLQIWSASSCASSPNQVMAGYSRVRWPVWLKNESKFTCKAFTHQIGKERNDSRIRHKFVRAVPCGKKQVTLTKINQVDHFC